MTEGEIVFPVDRRRFLALFALTGFWWVEGCKGDMPWDKEKKSGIIQVPLGSSIKDVLVAAKAEPKTRPTGLGEEVIAIGDRRATKKGLGIPNNDDGFVVLINGAWDPVELKGNRSLNAGKNTIEIRHVPIGVRGEDTQPFWTFDVVAS